jgi:hypothetical protein
MKKYFIAMVTFITLYSCTSDKKNEHRNMAKIELSNGKSVQCEILTKDEYQKKITDSSSKLLSKYKTEYNIEVFTTSINEVIVNEEGDYTLYHTIDDLEKVLNDANNSSNGTEVLFNKNPYGSDFPNHTGELISKLSTLLKINETPDILDMEYLKKVDEKINLTGNPQEFYEQNFINIIALIGTVVIQKYEGQWDMELADDKHTWNPNLKVKNESLEFFTYLYEDVFLNNQTKNIIPEVYQTAVDIVRHNIK